MLTLDGSPLLWNAHTGHKYDVQDTNCPLKSIGCVFNHENVRLLVQGSYFIRLLLILNGEFHGLLVLTTEEHLHFSGVLIHVFLFSLSMSLVLVFESSFASIWKAKSYRS